MVMKNTILASILAVTLFNGTYLYADTYQVQSGDNLSSIAMKYRYSSVSADQMMAAIFTANPSAFSGNNINSLKVGKTLQIPSESDVDSLSKAKASTVINNHAYNSEEADITVIQEALAKLKQEIAETISDLESSQKVLQKNTIDQ